MSTNSPRPGITHAPPWAQAQTRKAAGLYILIQAASTLNTVHIYIALGRKHRLATGRKQIPHPTQGRGRDQGTYTPSHRQKEGGGAIPTHNMHPIPAFRTPHN